MYQDEKADGAQVTVDAVGARVRALIPQFRARARETELERRVSAESIEALLETGFVDLLKPRRFGGLEGAMSDVARIAFDLGQGCASTAWCGMQAVFHNWLASLYPREAQEEVFDNPRVVVSHSGTPTGKCEVVDGGVRLWGAWGWCSNCDNATWIVLSAFTPPKEEGQPPAPTWFLLPIEAVRIDHDSWHSAGMAGTGSKTVYIDEPVFVPAHRALTVPAIMSGNTPGGQLHENPMYRLCFPHVGPLMLVSVPVGVATGALADFTEMARTKTAIRMGGPPIAMSLLPHVQSTLVEAAVAVETARTLLLNDIEGVERELRQGILPTQDVRVLNRRNHSYAGRLARQCVNLIFEASGASVGDLAMPIQRAWRDVNVGANHMSLMWGPVSSLFSQQQLGLPVTGATF